MQGGQYASGCQHPRRCRGAVVTFCFGTASARPPARSPGRYGELPMTPAILRRCGARGIKITFADPQTPNQVQVGYIWAVGDTTLAGVMASASNAADADAVATKGAQAQKPLVVAAPAGATPAAPAKPTATPVPAG